MNVLGEGMKSNGNSWEGPQLRLGLGRCFKLGSEGLVVQYSNLEKVVLAWKRIGKNIFGNSWQCHLYGSV